DRVVPSFVRPGGEIPDLSLVVSKKDGRHFMKAHGGALSNGFFTRDASRTRNISVVFRDTAFKAEASLADIYTLANLGPHDIRTAPSTRPAFLVKASPGLLCGGTGAALLYPPEAFSVFHPDAPAPLPLDTGGAVRLFVGGEMRGLYIMESLDRIGSAWMATGPYDKARPKFVLSSAPPTVPAWQVGLTPSGISRLFRRAAAFFESDPAFPWSRAEAAWQAKQHTKRRALWGFPAPEISALDLKGGNESPHFVVSDLDLKAAGEGVKWVSSRPDVISDEGALLARPDAPGGTVVELSAAFPGGERRTFRFRVMPPRLRLPALFLHVSRPVPYDGKTAFSATRFPALSDGSAAGAEHLVGADGAGIHLRGNTSLLKGAKRPLSLEFDEPVPWSGAPGGSRHVLLLSGYADPTRLRNAFSFHAFRLMSPENAGLCVPVSWTELFVNGEYYGVWESCPRLCDVVRREALSLLKVRSPDGFWTEVSADMVDDALKGRGGVADPYRDFLALSRLVVEAPSDEFAAKWRDEFDGGNLGDYWLLLNFTGDKDGMRTNQFIMRRASDGRAVVCPWDCDKTFERRRAYSAILGNPLIRRVEAADPDFRRKCGEKWKALRQGPLSDAAVEAGIDGKAAVFAPLMAEEWHLLKPEGYDGSFDEAVQHLKEEISARAALLDSRF
ncbi:MAG: CotH kinase family protein, partial [Kiritimatiellae bacterium]|nr:CotH kinase family protein [Kiritimatiellia bacterium]